MNITIINDCRDANAAGRQMTRASALIGGSTSFIGVSNDLEAAGNLIDALDAYGDLPGVVLVNVAPRNGAAKKWENGTPFGYFWYKKVLVVSSIDGLALSLIKKLQVTNVVHVLDIPTVVQELVREEAISPDLSDHIINSQFRSYDFVPRIAAYLLKNNTMVSESLALSDISEAPPAVWWIDNFGNCKTTLLEAEIKKNATNGVMTPWGAIPYYARLKDVPNDGLGVIVGSSGLGEKRFLEIVLQGGSAAERLGIAVGAVVTESE